MQACPYDALYIDPETHTAAKCNYCAHRIDVGLEPACVNVCPTQAIISGDLDNPESKISQLKNQQPVVARKIEKGTLPALFYIEADADSLNPLAAPVSGQSMWGTQVAGVGHWSGEHGEHVLDRLGNLLNLGDTTAMVAEIDQSPLAHSFHSTTTPRGEQLLGAVLPAPRRAYDAPQKGILWGWQVSAYLWTKSIAAGACFLPLVARTCGAQVPAWLEMTGLFAALIFLGLTGLLLMWDLDQPQRFLYVLLRPQWRSWLVKGAYIIVGFSALLPIEILLRGGGYKGGWELVVRIGLIVLAALAAVYTAFLFAQARGRDFWQSPALPVHMLTHSLTAGAALFALLLPFQAGQSWDVVVRAVLIVAIVIHLAGDSFELFGSHLTEDSSRTAHAIARGQYRNLFWFGAVVLGSIVPILCALLIPSGLMPVAGLCALAGVFVGQHIWVRAPQQVPLS